MLGGRFYRAVIGDRTGGGGAAQEHPAHTFDQRFCRSARTVDNGTFRGEDRKIRRPAVFDGAEIAQPSAGSEHDAVAARRFYRAVITYRPSGKQHDARAGNRLYLVEIGDCPDAARGAADSDRCLGAFDQRCGRAAGAVGDAPAGY